MKTYEQIRTEIYDNNTRTMTFAQLEEMAAKEYAKQYLRAAATTLEVYDNVAGKVSQIAYKLMDEIDAQ
jgi:hypothetical protein